MADTTGVIVFDEADQIGDAIDLAGGELFAISLSANDSLSGTMSLQRSFDSGSTWHTIQTYTEAGQDDGMASAPQKMRLALTAYSSGAISGEIIRSRTRG